MERYHIQILVPGEKGWKGQVNNLPVSPYFRKKLAEVAASQSYLEEYKFNKGNRCCKIIDWTGKSHTGVL